MKCKWCKGNKDVLDNICVAMAPSGGTLFSRRCGDLCESCCQYISDGIIALLDPANRPGAKQEPSDGDGNAGTQ